VTAAADSPIENYLDELVTALSTSRPRELRQLLAETEAHLHDDADRAIADGVPPERAEALAVARFGPARELARADAERLVTPLGVLIRQTGVTALLLSGLGGVAVGVSGILAGLMGAFAGSRFLVDLTPGQALAPSDCARWLAADPTASSCREAAVTDWAAETVAYRIAAGIVGIGLLLAYSWVRRRAAVGCGRSTTLPDQVSNTMGLTLFGAAGLWMVALGVDAIVVSSGRGSGQWFSAAPVAVVTAALFGRRLLRDLRSDDLEPLARRVGSGAGYEG
jgi:HAAS